MFKRFKDWLLEVTGQQYDYGCIVLYGKCKEFNSIQASLDVNDVNTFEDDYHLTVLYGIKPGVPTSKVVELIESYNFLGKSMWCKQLDIFKNEGQDDVVKLSIEDDPSLIEFRNHLMANLDNEQTHEGYNPHITVAYVKEGMGEKYIHSFEEPVEFVPNRIVYSEPSRGDEHIITSIPIMWS